MASLPRVGREAGLLLLAWMWVVGASRREAYDRRLSDCKIALWRYRTFAHSRRDTRSLKRSPPPCPFEANEGGGRLISAQSLSPKTVRLWAARDRCAHFLLCRSN